MSAIVIWRPEPLTARLSAAAIPARQAWARAAQTRAPKGIHVGVIGEAVGSLDPIAGFFEFGTKPHEIEPKRQILKMADGGFVTGPVRHPGMKGQPFLRPTLPAWPEMYRRAASGAVRGF